MTKNNTKKQIIPRIPKVKNRTRSPQSSTYKLTRQNYQTEGFNMKHWSQEEMKRVESAHAECMTLMGEYADRSVLNILIIEGKTPSPDEIIDSMYIASINYINSMLFINEAEHKNIKINNFYSVNYHYVVEKNWINYDYDIPENKYNYLNIKLNRSCANIVLENARKDLNIKKENIAKKRKAITLDCVSAAVNSVNKKILAIPKDYNWQEYDLNFTIIANELKMEFDISLSKLKGDIE